METSVLDGRVDAVSAFVSGLTDHDQLDALETAEREGKGRKGVLRVIDARIGALMEMATT